MAAEHDTRVLIAMAFALASAGRDGVNRVLDALADRNRADDALAYLVELGRPHVAAVAARLSDPNPVVREQIAIALGFIGGPEAAAALKGASGESDPASGTRSTSPSSESRAPTAAPQSRATRRRGPFVTPCSAD
jgi:HEAT repeat protein